MAEPVAAPAPTKPKAGPVSAPRVPWDQQQGENDLWYARFLRYLALGPSRSVSLVATGRRNAYPIPAHWPIQAKQHNWRQRSSAFDEAVRAAAAEESASVIQSITDKIRTLVEPARATAGKINGEALLLQRTLEAGGYQAPPSDDYDDEAVASASN